MTIYEDSWPADEWNVTATLDLQDDGAFRYDEWWTCYLGSTGGGGSGRWSRDGETIVLRPERVEGSLFLSMEEGRELLAIAREGGIELRSGFLLRPLEPAPATLPSAPPITGGPRPTTVSPPPVKSTPDRRYPRAERVLPSIELAGKIERWVHEAVTSAGGLGRLCRENEILFLHATSIYLWGLRSDGRVMCIDHESVRRDAAEETDPLRAFAVLTQGAKTHPELDQLIPPRPVSVVECEPCDGTGWTRDPDGIGTSGCLRCAGLGWYSSG